MIDKSAVAAVKQVKMNGMEISTHKPFDILNRCTFVVIS